MEGLGTALIAAIAASLVVRGLEIREMRRYSFGTGCKRGVPAAGVPVDVDGDLAGQGLRSRGRAWTDLATRSPGPWSPTATRRSSPPQVCCSDAGDPSIAPSTRCGSCGSVRSVRIGLESDQGLCGPRDAMRNCLHALKVATRVRNRSGLPMRESITLGPTRLARGRVYSGFVSPLRHPNDCSCHRSSQRKTRAVPRQPVGEPNRLASRPTDLERGRTADAVSAAHPARRRTTDGPPGGHDAQGAKASEPR